MKCSYHPAIDAQETCNACGKFLCAECAHKIRGKAHCQDCLVEGAQRAATFKGLKLPTDAPRRAAICAVIPGLGAVYNGEYLKAVSYFAIWSALAMLGSRVNGVFAFGAVVFVIYTMFDAYRCAEVMVRRRLQQNPDPANAAQDKTVIGWGVFLILLGVFFLLENLIPYNLIDRLWPVIFIALGAYLVYYALQRKKKQPAIPQPPVDVAKEDF